MPQTRNRDLEKNAEMEGNPLRTQLVVTPHSEATCAILEEITDAHEVRHDYKIDISSIRKLTHNGESVYEFGDCHTEITDADTETRRYFRSTATEKCICPVFENHDCIWEIEEVKGNSLVIEVSIPNRNELVQLIEGLREVGASLSVNWLVNNCDGSSTTEMDVNSITTRQQEALETAIQKGYYETPRETDLSEVAEDLDISVSAASQRLNAAETKLVKSFLDE